MPRAPIPAATAAPRCALVLTTLASVLLATSAASATQFSYVLANHPDGNAQHPLYGLRLDELFDATAGHDIFTFDFEDPASDMSLVYDDGGTPGDGALGDDSIHIFGSVFGGLDTGTGYDDPLHAGVWDVDFTYSANIASAGAGGTQIEVTPDSPQNQGSITPTFAVGGVGATLGVPIVLFDEDGSQGLSFHFDNTSDHRLGGSGLSGPDTFVGWGWLSYAGGHVESSDWLFTATVVPEPGTSLLVASGLAALAAIRRRS